MTARLAILADDLTGAADTGAPFAAAGRPTLALLSPDAPATVPSADVIVLTSQSRALPPDAAMTATRRCATRIAEWCQGDDSVRVYKKIDSTLRGHPALELRVLMDALGAPAALVAPAFPAQGRTTVRGRQLVDGVPIERTAFAQEAATSSLRDLFARVTDGAVAMLSRADLQRGVGHLADRLTREREIRLWIADAEDDSDLAVVADAALASPLRVLCGSSGLARAMAGVTAHMPVPAHADNVEAPVLVVAGSRHAATTAQVAALLRGGAVGVWPEVAFLESGDPLGAAQAVAHAVDVLARGRSVVLSTARLPEVCANRVDVAARLAAIAAAACDRVRVLGLVLTGGDTAAAVCDALGASGFWLTDEVMPGMAMGTLVGGRHPALPIVTKAGGFGDDDALRHAVAFLGPTG